MNKDPVCDYRDGEGWIIDTYDYSQIPCPSCHGSGRDSEADEEPPEDDEE